ncbi:tail collar domain [Cupriavidus phytorum]|uniref:Tail collar domain n=1 Tax=Cupriavidus phytorum TaxID=3024399 RepID=A0A2W7PA10_9BURK|nr:phage tail protein [Cupriavidus alkaliphilus]PZX32066.1 tail collar domain [Cupriavidus alkaliphilus]
MSQHDMDIANQAGAAFRADLNLALNALVTNGSGAAAPATTFAYMFWADTNAGLLRMRNGANTAWVTIGLLGVPNFGHILPGTVLYHAVSSVPAGYLKANGGAVSRTTYADLFNVLGTGYGSGDGSTTFNLPELRGEFIRGWDDGRGVDAGRVIGIGQADDLKTHLHSTQSVVAGGGAVTGLQIATNGISQGFMSTTSTGGAETRPRNMALMAIIKF